MKKIFKLLIFSSFFLVSCEKDLLEPFIPGQLSEDVATENSSDLQRIMNSSYNILTNRQEAVFNSVFTDEVGIGFSNGGQGINDNYIFFLNVTSNSVNSIWNTQYFTLARANRVIKFADKIVPIDEKDAQLLARLKAEALIIRALCHIKLLSYFSTDPTDDNALAAVISNRIVSTIEPPLPRSTNGEFYSLIHSDLDNALVILKTNTSTFPTTPANIRTFYLGINAAKALKARAYALKGDYVNAEKWADDVINNSGIKLATPAQYTELFFKDNEPANTEVIFRLKRTPQQNGQGTNLHNGWCSVSPSASGSPFYEVSRALFNLLEKNPSDIRRNTIVSPSSVIDPNYSTSNDYRNTDKIIINKHGGVLSGNVTAASTSTNGFNNDIKIIRISEMYLIKAEARAKANDLNGVATIIKTIHDNRYPSAQPLPVYNDVTKAWKAILDERRIEFAFEGYRYIDIKRIGKLAGISGVDRDPADYSSNSSNYSGANPSNLPLTSFKWTFPIPQDELNANSSIKQNPGY